MGIGLAVGLLLLGCGSPRDVEPDLIFVRGGWIGPEDRVTGEALGDGRAFAAGHWEAGLEVEVAGRVWTAPVQPSCEPLFHVPLGDVGGWIAAGGEPPDTVMAFSPDGRILAIGTWTGEVRLVDGWTGREIATRRLSETLIKRVAWSSDGRTLYAAEQSPDAYVHALDVPSLKTRVRLRLADEVGTSAAPSGEDLYGVYSLPSAYGLSVMPDGELWVVATHGWNDAEGVRRNQSRVLRLGPDLDIRGRWPAEGAADAVILSATLGSGRLAVSLGRSATNPSTGPELPLNGVQVLSWPSLEPAFSVTAEPLKPWFDRSFIWDALDLSERGEVAVGFGDGRVVLGTDSASRTHALSTPIPAGDVAVVASVGSLVWHGEQVVAMTSGTNIPWGSADPSLRPPRAHPNENAVFGLSTGETLGLDWVWRGPYSLSGLTLAEDERTLVVGAGSRRGDQRTDLFGALVFDLQRSGSGPEKLSVVCPTEGPVFFRQAVSREGRIAVAEHPYRHGDEVGGRYQLTVFR